MSHSTNSLVSLRKTNKIRLTYEKYSSSAYIVSSIIMQGSPNKSSFKAKCCLFLITKTKSAWSSYKGFLKHNTEANIMTKSSTRWRLYIIQRTSKPTLHCMFVLRCLHNEQLWMWTSETHDGKNTQRTIDYRSIKPATRQFGPSNIFKTACDSPHYAIFVNLKFLAVQGHITSENPRPPYFRVFSDYFNAYNQQ